MTLFRLINVDYNSIDINDNYYRISDDDGEDQIYESIKSYGLLSIPLLLQKEDRLIVISGFKRIRSCLKAGLTNNPAMVTDCADLIVCAKIAVMENAKIRILSVLEKIRSILLIKKSHDSSFLSDCFYQNSCEALGIPYTKKIVDMLLEASDLPATLLKIVNDDFLSLSVAIGLKDFRDIEINLIEKIFTEFKASLNKQKEMIILVKEISKLEKQEYGIILNELHEHIQAVKLKNTDRNFLLKFSRDYLFRRRYPNISAEYAKFNDMVSILKFPDDVKFLPPDNFEGRSYHLCFNFSNLDKLKNLLKQIQIISLQKEMEMIMNREYQ